MIDFSKQDIIFIYGRIKIELYQLEITNETTGDSLDAKSYNQRADTLRSITEKIEAAFPDCLDDALQHSFKKLAKDKLFRI